jgi:hypothetical protein
MGERPKVVETAWRPAGGSYEEAVLSWHEQIESSFRRRDIDAQRQDLEARDSESAATRTVVPSTQ